VFRPVDRTVARQKLSRAWGRDITTAYVVVMNSANKGSPSRKGFDEALQAFKALTKVRDDAVLYMHCEREGTWSGENLPLLIAMNQIDPNKVIFADQYRYNMGLLSEQYLNDVYNAADIFLHASRGEGFGIPLVEAQAAGCPVIAPRSSAMTELTHDELQVGIRTHIMHTSGARLAVVDTEALGRKLIEISQADAAALRADALWRGQQYDYRLVYQKYMGPALDRIRDEIAATRRKADADAEKRASYASPAPVADQGNDRDADLQPVERDSVVSGEPATDD
jgi:glycosyltransferase involved in cell wall biosynthesis